MYMQKVWIRLCVLLCRKTDLFNICMQTRLFVNNETFSTYYYTETHFMTDVIWKIIHVGGAKWEMYQVRYLKLSAFKFRLNLVNDLVK